MEHGDEPLDHPVHPAGPRGALSAGGETGSVEPAPAARDERRKTPLVLRLALLAMVLGPAFFWKGGVLEEETIVFLDHYLDGRSPVQKVFDPHGNDFDTYQARELSYLVDFLDARSLRACLRSGFVAFIPPSAIVASLLTWGLFARGSARAFPGVPGRIRALVLLILLTNYVFLTTMGLFYRATKPMLTPFLLALIFFLWQRLVTEPDRTGNVRDGLVVLLLGGLVSAFDRQGFFYVAILAVGLGLVLAATRRGAILFAGAAAAAASSALYNYALGPLLIHAINGYWPRFNYQGLPARKLLDPTYYAKAAELLPGYAATLLGGAPVWLLAIVGAASLVAWLRVRSRRPSATSQAGENPGPGWLGPVLVAIFIASQVFMFAAMIMRYPMVYDWADHRLWYYPWPFQAILAAGLLAMVADAWPRIAPSSRAVLQAALVLLVVGNVAAWPRLRATSLRSAWFPKIHDQSERLKASLREGRADPGLYGAYRDFLYFVWDRSPVLRSRVLVDVREGSGFYRTELKDGRLFAWARKGAALRLTTRVAGDYRIAGELWLRRGETVTLSRAGAPLAKVSRTDDGEGGVPFSATLTLKAGEADLDFESDRDERDIGGFRDGKAVSFGLFLPTLAQS